MVSCVAIVEGLGVPNGMVERKIHQAFGEKPMEILWKGLNELTGEEKGKVDALVSVKCALPKEVLSQFTSLKVIAVAFTGYGTVDLDYCRENKVQVFNVPAYSTDSVAELVIGLTISLLRDIPKGNSLIRSGGWNLGYAGSDLSQKVVGIVGTGTIGIRTAQLFKAFNCKLIGWSRTQREEFLQLGAQYVESLEVVCIPSFYMYRSNNECSYLKRQTSFLFTYQQMRTRKVLSPKMYLLNFALHLC